MDKRREREERECVCRWKEIKGNISAVITCICYYTVNTYI